MTDKQKNQIAEYREQGMSYTEISKKMDLSINSIKTYCKRHGLGGVKAYEIGRPAEIVPCEHCGKPVQQNPGRKPTMNVLVSAVGRSSLLMEIRNVSIVATAAISKTDLEVRTNGGDKERTGCC